ncbi:hypothetical protein [Hahella ganghwensis]|uniref:hypothetical protein n=1 Tax=Hahella ganghwensis TaxID=286420 RepID=UPI000378832D|nr:hypothetical protein [Hahella ganghwensis]
MNDLRKKLEGMREQIRKDIEKVKEVSKELPEDEHRLLGPRNDIEYQRMIKELKESKDED